MRRVFVAALVFIAVATGSPAVASTAADPSPVSEAGHTHYIVTGNGGCVDIDSLRWEAAARGLHQGATGSGGHGPNHGSCPA